MAPMSSIVDLPSDEEMRTKEQKKLKRSVKIASSEDESSANEKGHTKERSNGLTSQSESEPEQIDTSVKAEE